MNAWFRTDPDTEKLSRIPFLGVDFDPLEEAQVLEEILTRNPLRPFAPVVTPNADHLVRINHAGGPVADAYENAWLCLNDSRIVELLGHMRGLRVPVVPGSDLLQGLFDSPQFNPEWPILLVGATPETFSLIVERYGLTNAVHYDAPMGLLKDKQKFDDTVRFIIAHPARYTILAVGSPQQELIARSVVEQGGATGIGLCTGAAAEFLAYPERRAPRWISQARLEWLFRLINEPARLWHRYLISSPQILALFLREFRSRKGAQK